MSFKELTVIFTFMMSPLRTWLPWRTKQLEERGSLSQKVRCAILNIISKSMNTPRYIGTTTWQGIRKSNAKWFISPSNLKLPLGNVIHSVRPDLYASGVLPRGNPNLANSVRYKYNNEKGKKIFGLKYKTLKEIMTETFADFEERGWLVKTDWWSLDDKGNQWYKIQLLVEIEIYCNDLFNVLCSRYSKLCGDLPQSPGL